VPRILAALCAIELGVLFWQQPESLRFGGVLSVLAVLFIPWFWLSIAQCADWLSQPGRSKSLRWATAVSLGTGFVLYVASWGLLVRTGRYMNLDAVLFILNNPFETTWLYLSEAEHIAFVAAGIGGIIVTLVAGRLLSTPLKSNPNQSQLWRRMTPAVAFLVIGLFMDASEQRRSQRIDVAARTTHPVYTLACSLLDTMTLEEIEPCLHESELVAIQKSVSSSVTDQTASRPNVIFVAIESLRADAVYQRHQGREVMPHLNQLAQEGLRFTNAYAQSTHSDYSDVCIVSSLYPLRTRRHHYYRDDDPWPKTLAFDVFKERGYRTAIVSSQNESWGGMDRFLDVPALDVFYDAERSLTDMSYVPARDPGLAHEHSAGMFRTGCLYDEHTTDTAIRLMEECHKTGEPFFLSMNFQASHFPYHIPDHVPAPFQPCHLDDDVSFMSYPKEKTPMVRNAFFNAIHHCDAQIGRMVEALQRTGQLDNTIFVVLGENGEAFQENGRVGHAQHPFESMLKVACVVHAPGRVEPSESAYPMELIDVLPTVCSLAGRPAHPNFQGINVLAADRPTLDKRFLFFHVNCASANSDAVQWAGRWKYVLDHDTGASGLFDLQEDPWENQNIKGEHPALTQELHRTLTTWRARQLAFYHYSAYYSRYYPPRPPQPSHLQKQFPEAVPSTGRVATHTRP